MLVIPTLPCYFYYPAYLFLGEKSGKHRTFSLLFKIHQETDGCRRRVEEREDVKNVTRFTGQLNSRLLLSYLGTTTVSVDRLLGSEMFFRR